MPTMIPIKYKPKITKIWSFSKKAAVKNAYIGILAEQLIKGVSKIVIFLSRSEGNVLDAIIAGTLHPKPINIGTKLLPESPIFLNALSITNATRAI